MATSFRTRVFGVRDEFMNLDFPSVAWIVEHSNRPLMADISREILEPMYQAFLIIHADTIWNPETKSAEERRFMREKTRVYLELAGKLSDFLIRHEQLAEDLLIPAPRVAWLLSDVESRIHRPPNGVAIPPLLFVLLENFRSAEVNRDDYCGSPLGEVVYVQSFLRPFAHVIRSAIPSTVCGPDDMPFGCIAELEKYVVAYLERAALLYAISFEVSRRTGQSMKLDPSVYWCLSQAITFDYFLGKPTYGYVPDARESFLSRISLAANLANKARGPSSALDVQLTPDFASLPQLINNRACENTLLEDGIEQTQNFGRALEKSAMYADMGYSPNPSSRYFVPAQQRPTKRLSRPELVVLWIHRTRHLVQDLHHTTCIAVEEETPEETVGLIRDAVGVLLKNMVALGKASLKYGSFGDANTAGYFVPPEGTTLFGMAERFVDLYGYHGDTSPFDRALMFENLNTLFRTMVLDEEYLRFGINFPNFDVSKADLERYGIYEFIKPAKSLVSPPKTQGPWCINLEIAYCDTIRNWGTRLGTNFLIHREKVADELMDEEEDSDKEKRRLSPISGTGGARLRPHVTAARPWYIGGGEALVSTNADPPTAHLSARSDKTLELVCWRPSEGWAAFLEFRLCPMVYFVHAAVTHDFTLVSVKGVYSLVELDHIKYWVGRVLLHCRLLLSSRCAVCSVYMDDVCIRYPPIIGLPGEATAMFEIMHRVCRSVGYPFNQELWVLNLDLLIPLVESARETRALLRTAFNYPAFDEHGQLLIPDFYSVEGRPQGVSRERDNRGIRFRPDNPSWP
ncbi:hypothetical protein B0H14DRAFT_3513566 [Mycena olivaceomarginata]|nr:hypothetical protein B0H14DRAFT_3513566 [Mycena olivaceomarginata]